MTEQRNPIPIISEIDSRSIDELIRQSLLETDEEKAWEPVVILHRRGTREVYNAARELCSSILARERQLGAGILGQLGSPERKFPEETLEILLPMLQTETDVETLNSVCIALGHLHEPGAIEPLSRLKNYPHEDVRYGVVFGLLGHEDELAVRTLIELSEDENDDVRNWATFGIARQLDLDDSEIDPNTPEIIEALHARLTDPIPVVRAEAFLGLALRGDASIAESLSDQLSHIDLICPVEKVYDDYALGLLLEAAKEFCHPTLLPALLSLKEEFLEGDPTLEEAILSIPLWNEAVKSGAWIAKVNLRLKESIEEETVAALPLGYRGFLRVEGRDDLWPFRVVWGPLEGVPDFFEDLRLDLGTHTARAYGKIIEDLSPFDIIEEGKIIGQGSFSRIWRPGSIISNQAG